MSLAELQFVRSRDRLLDTVSHELRTPLTVILARTDILSRRLKDQDEKIVKGLSAVTNSAIELKGLVNRLIDHAGRALTATAENHHPISLKELEGTLQSELRAKFADADIRFNECGSDKVFVTCDASQIAQGLSEFVDNGLKYGPADSPIEIATSVVENQVRLAVIDQGTDLTPGDAIYLFQPYERGTMMGNNAARGTGLGLHFAKAVAEIHGGAVHFENDPDKRSVFVLSLPVSRQG